MGLAQSADHEENTHVGCRIVDSDWGAGHSDVLLCAGSDINVIVSRAVMADVLQRFRQDCEHLCIERTGVLYAVSRIARSVGAINAYLGGVVGSVESDYIVVLASFAVCNELLSGSAGKFLICLY